LDANIYIRRSFGRGIVFNFTTVIGDFREIWGISRLWTREK